MAAVSLRIAYSERFSLRQFNAETVGCPSEPELL